jgi:tyrosyl-DNA phosphodiesterase 2
MTQSPRGLLLAQQTLSLTSWNIQASQSRPVDRSELILDHILKGPKFPDINFLQEVASTARQSLLSNPRVRSSFLTTDAEDDTSFKGVPFATMTLLSSKRFGSPLLAEEEEEGEGEGKGGSKMVLDSVFRMELPSRYERDALCVNIAAPAVPGAVLRLLNVHLDSLDSQFRRALQMHILAGLLRELGCSGGIIAGDFNAILPDDHMLVDKHELVDAWVALHGSTTGPDGGATWGVGVELRDGLKPGRLDKVVMLGLQPDEIDVLQPGLIDAYMPWSDHCGLRCTFTV